MKHFIFLLWVVMGIMTSQAQSFYDIDSIQTIEITFAQTNWDQLLDAQKSGNEDYIMAQSISINGVVMDSIGVKYKGNSTYNANQTKNPFHIELDTYKDHDYQGYTDIKLSNVAKDPSFIREVLSYQILRKYMDAPLSNYANVYVNGNLLGLYSNSESVSKKFVKSRFNSKNNTFIKCNPPAGAGPQSSSFPNLVYLGSDSSSYYESYELKSEAGWQELIDFCDTLTNHITDIEAILDVDRALWMLAYNNVLVNLDSYIGRFAQNYYLYRDDNNRFVPVVWDLNESFGKFSDTGSGNLQSTTAKQQMSHLLHSTDASFPLVQKLLNVPMYKRMYLAHFKTILLENFDNGDYYAEAQNLQAIIDASVQADGNKFFTYANFLSNLNSDIGGGGGPGGGSTPGIASLMNGRSSYLLGLSDFTQTEPTIANITLSNPTPVSNETITISANIANGTTVYLGYRGDKYAKFTRIQMYDDGTHNDGAANDGVYGIDLTLSNDSTQYYIYAENATIGMFSPRRAEHEYYTVTTSLISAPGDLVINEFMADNDSVVADGAGEFDDWIELYNNGSTSIDLQGYFLSDDSESLQKWTFPEGATIGANDYLQIWADDDSTQSGLHANFKLSADGESIFLSNAQGEVVDAINYDEQIMDVSYSRIPNGTGDFTMTPPTFGTENSLMTAVDDLETIDFALYPNPVKEILYLTFDDNRSKSLQIFSVDGKFIQSQEIENHQQSLEINVQAWPAGIYYLRLFSENFVVNKKVVVLN